MQGLLAACPAGLALFPAPRLTALCPAPPCSRGPDQAAVKAACDDLGVALIAYSPLALGGWN